MPRLRERNRNATRELIMGVAERLFVRHGFDTVTLERVAGECEVAVRTVLRYFSTKEGLALARAQESIEAFKEGLEGRDCDAVSYWRSFLSERTGEVVSRQSFRRPYLRMIDEHPALRGQLEALNIEIEDLLAAALAEETGDSGLGPRFLASMLVGGHLAIRRDWIYSDQPYHPELFFEGVDFAVDIFRDRYPHIGTGELPAAPAAPAAATARRAKS